MTEQEKQVMNVDKYAEARYLIHGLDIWVDYKHLLLSVVSRAERLEQEVLLKQDALDERDRMIKEFTGFSYYEENRRLKSEVERFRLESQANGNCMRWFQSEYQRLRKALQEIATIERTQPINDIRSLGFDLGRTMGIARQVLAGEEDDELKFAVAAMRLEEESE
jgi:hypothetical protein